MRFRIEFAPAGHPHCPLKNGYMDGIHETEMHASLAFLIDTIANRLPDPAGFREAYRAMLAEFIPATITRVREGKAVVAEIIDMPAGGDLQMIITASR